MAIDSALVNRKRRADEVYEASPLCSFGIVTDAQTRFFLLKVHAGTTRGGLQHTRHNFRILTARADDIQ